MSNQDARCENVSHSSAVMASVPSSALNVSASATASASVVRPASDSHASRNLSATESMVASKNPPFLA